MHEYFIDLREARGFYDFAEVVSTVSLDFDRDDVEEYLYEVERSGKATVKLINKNEYENGVIVYEKFK